MSEQTAEQAWDVLCRTPVLEYTGKVNERTAKDTRDAARVLALTVLDEAEHCHQATSPEPGICPYCAAVLKLRRRIEALG